MNIFKFLLTGIISLTLSAAIAQQAVGAGSVNSTTPVVTGHPGAGTFISGSYREEKKIKDEDLKSKEVNKEINAPKGTEIYIQNFSRGIVIKTWDQPKVKVTTTVYYDGESKLTDEEWLEKVNLSLKILGGSVKIKSGVISTGASTFLNSSDLYTVYGSSGGNAAVFNGSGQNIGTKATIKSVVTVTIPAGSKLDIESKYADISLPAGIGDANVDITNGNLEAENLTKLILRSKYSNINVGDVKTAEVELANGRFSAKIIDDLDIDSKNSTIEMAEVKKLVIRSGNDEYEVEEAGEVRGRKSYGNLRITKLNGLLDVEGTNADVKIRKAGPSLSLIKLDDKYADVRIPLRDTKNYSVDFTGNYSSVYGNFEKKALAMNDKEKDNKGIQAAISVTKPSSSAAASSGSSNITAITVEGVQIPADRRFQGVLSSSWNDGSNPSRFTAAVGDGKGLKIEIKCQNCTVDFK